MYVIVAPIQIKPGYKDRFLQEMIGDAKGSAENEPGCLRFDVHQDNEDPNRFYLYEVYRDSAAFDAHREAPHFKRFGEATREVHATPALVHRCTNVFPSDNAWK